MPPTLPLAHIKVLDLTRARAGPTAVRQLADWGADVIKIEAPGGPGQGEALGGARHAPDFLNLHRNKRAMTLNLKSDRGRELFLELAKSADVVVENYRPDVKHRLGIDYEAVRAVNDKIIYGSISGFGQDGPYGYRAGVDQIAQGMGGLMSITGLPGQGPVRVGIPIADLTAGMFLAQGILLALLHRDRTGEGQWLHTSLLQAQVSMLDFQAARWLIDQEVPPQAGNNHPTGIPMGVFPTEDGAINIAAAGQVLWLRFLKSIGAEHLNEDERYSTAKNRSINRDVLNETLSEITKTKPSAYWIETLNEAGVPCGPIYSIDQVFNDPQVKHLKIAYPMQHPAKGRINVIAQPIELTASPQPPETRLPTPEQGEHTIEILRQLDLSDEEIANLRDEGVV